MTTEDDVEAMGVCGRVAQIGTGEMDHGAQLGPGDPGIVGLVEPAQHGLGPEAALDFKAGVGTRTGLLQRTLGKIGSDDLDRDPRLLGGDGQGPGLLAR